MTGHEDTGVTLRRELEDRFRSLDLKRRFRRACYDPGHRLKYAITGVAPANEGRMTVEVERFVGGGFAGQVYRVKLLRLEGEIEGLVEGKHYAIKILKPPSRLAEAFRNVLYFLAYQSHFGAQVNPDAVRVGVLWQKLIRRAAEARFQAPGCVCDTFATFYDEDSRSFGEINEWVDGRIWRFEVDDRLFSRWRFEDGLPDDHNCPEYVSKKMFMDDLVAMLHEMGAPELARQYEWWTMKSQPNALKRTSADTSPRAGVTAIDFRAGLTLLPFLPMSPADFRLILRGLIRGRIVQFDRSDPRRFGRFIQEHAADFAGLEAAIEELRERERAYRASMPDVTAQGFRLLVDADLRQTAKKGVITSWKHLGRLDDKHAGQLAQGTPWFLMLYILSFLPFVGRALVKLWGNDRAREHYMKCVTSLAYLLKAMEGARIETLVAWQRRGRVSDDHAVKLVDRPARYWIQRILLGWSPASLHRFATEPSYAWEKVRNAVAFTLRFLRVPEFREQILLEQVRTGREEGMLTDAEATRIGNEVKDPYIQKYLRCLAVHVCTVPVTQVVMVLAGAAVVAYCLTYRQQGWAESMAFGAAAAAIIQLSPISPGSIARGLFVIFMMIKDRDIKSYYIAAPVSFLHVVGYLAFPLQMVSHNPALARFLAGSWSKNLVHIVPVFGERGGLLEHWVFDFFFNLPLSIKRGFKTNPVIWTVNSLAAATALAGVIFLVYSCLWEYCQPKARLEGCTVSSIAPYNLRAGDLHWRFRHLRVHFEGTPEAVGFPAARWDDSIQVGDITDAVIRKDFFSDGYDGLAVSRRSGPVAGEPNTQGNE
jgi:hypothetical protein